MNRNYKSYFILFNFVVAQDPNLELVLANSGMNLGADTSLDRRILTAKPNYNNSFGKDPELERNARAMKNHLAEFKDLNNPTTEEWIDIKNLAVSAVKGDCKASDKLFENKIIPHAEYDRLIKRCGKTAMDNEINKDLQALRIREKAGDAYAHSNLDHLKKYHSNSEDNQSPGSDHNNNFGDSGNSMKTGHSLNYSMSQSELTHDDIHDSLFNDPEAKRDASAIRAQNNTNLKSKLRSINTAFSRAALERIDHFQHAADDVMHGVTGATEKFVDFQHDNRRFSETTLGHDGLDAEIRKALGTTSHEDQIHAISVPLHDHEERMKEAALKNANEIAINDSHLHDSVGNSQAAVNFSNVAHALRDHDAISQELENDLQANKRITSHALRDHDAISQEIENDLHANKRITSHALRDHDAISQELENDLHANKRITSHDEINEEIANAAHKEIVNDIAERAGLEHSLAAQSGISEAINSHKEKHLSDTRRAQKDADMHAQQKAVLESHQHEMEAEKEGRINDFAEQTFNTAIKTGVPKSNAVAYSKQAGMLAKEFEDNLDSGMNRSEAADRAMTMTNNATGQEIPERVISAFKKLYAHSETQEQISQEHQSKLNNEAYPESPEMQENAERLTAAIVADPLKLTHVIEEIGEMKNIAEVKIAEAENKMNAAEEMIKEAKLTAQARNAIDKEKKRITENEKGESAFNRKQVELLNDKKKRYETSLAMNQPKSIRNASNLKDLTDLDEAYNEILHSNQKIVEQEKILLAEAEERLMPALPETPDASVAEINSTHELSTEKKNARLAEEILAKEAEEKEIQAAKMIAAQNVKRFGGSNDEATIESNKAAMLKRKLIEEEKHVIAHEIKEKLRPQIGDRIAKQEAEHLAMTHSGKNPIGNSLLEVEDHQKNVEMNEEDKMLRSHQSADERNLVVKLIPDNASQIVVDNSVIELPLTGVPNAKAKTVEEENIKKELETLRDEIRNKVTKKNFNSGLSVVKGIEGYMNLPESCKEAEVKKGTVYYDQAGYNFMIAQKIDVSPLTAVYSRGDEPVYYKAMIKDMKMKLPSILNSNQQKILYNEFESINIDYAKRLEVVNGVVNCEPWSSFSSRMRPKVYKGISKGGDEVPDSIKMEFERIENDKGGLTETDVKIIKNPDGVIMAEITPQFGITSKMKIEEAVQKAKEAGGRRQSATTHETHLNVAEDPPNDYTQEFMELVEKDMLGKKEYDKILNSKNPITSSASSRIESIRKQPALKDLILSSKRPGNDEAVKSYNKLVENSEKVAKDLSITAQEFIESISRVDNATISQMLEYFFDVSGSLNYQKKLAQMDSQKFVAQIKQYFPRQEVPEIVKEFFNAFSEVTRIPNVMEGTPVKTLVKMPQSVSTCCLALPPNGCDSKNNKAACGSNPRTCTACPMRQQPFAAVPYRNPDNSVIVQPASIHTKKVSKTIQPANNKRNPESMQPASRRTFQINSKGGPHLILRPVPVPVETHPKQQLILNSHLHPIPQLVIHQASHLNTHPIFTPANIKTQPLTRPTGDMLVSANGRKLNVTKNGNK